MSPDGQAGVDLVVLIVKSHRKVEEILTGFLELGIRGATVVDAKGMGQIISTDIPIFTGFKSLFPGGGSQTYIILSVIEHPLVPRACRLAEELCGSFEEPGSGVLFVLPVSWVKGMAREIE